MTIVGEKDPRLDLAGTPESAWVSARLDQLPALELGNYRHAVMVAPHPDDEVLASAGLMQRLASRGIPLTVVSVTDGEASHPTSRTATPAILTDMRSLELRQALDYLGLGARIRRLGLPDGHVAVDVSDLVACLSKLLAPDVLCVAPWERDGHPDHDATGHAAARACATTGAPFLRSLVWTWHWATPGSDHVPWLRARRLALSHVELTRKRWATRSFGSQVTPLSDLPGDEAILPAETLAYFDRPYEVFLA
jgi:LmbE family N-acetylglucosaminyl deacetylase